MARALDPDATVMIRPKAPSRGPVIVALGVVGCALALSVLHVLDGRSAVAAELERRGYSETALAMKGPFTWAFTGMKGRARCDGTFERVVFTKSMSETCIDTRPATSSLGMPRL